MGRISISKKFRLWKPINVFWKKQYDTANNYIGQQEDICCYFAVFLNAIENRIDNLQEHLLTIEPMKPFVNSDTEPSAADNQTIWI